MDAEKLTHGNSYTVYNGIAAMDLVKGSNVLNVICPDLMPHAASGTVAAGSQDTTVSASGRNGAVVHTKVTSANYIEATWEGQDFVRYPPMVRKGEPVEVYYSVGQDKYQWRSTGKGRLSRSTDRLCFEISASPNNTGDSKTDVNTYSVEMDSDNQTIDIRTSNANGEAAPFRFGANLKTGQWWSTDSADINNTKTANRVFMDTGASTGTPVYQINLKTGVCLQMVNKDLRVTVPGNMFFNVAGRTVFNSPLTIFNPQKAGVVIANVSSVGLTVTKDIVANIAGVLGINAASTKFAGTVIAAGFRGGSFVYGVLGALYNAVKISNPEVGTPQESANTADTDAAGNSDHAAISGDSVVSCMDQINTAFGEVRSKIGVPGDTSGLSATAKNGFFKSLKGE